PVGVERLRQQRPASEEDEVPVAQLCVGSVLQEEPPGPCLVERAQVDAPRRGEVAGGPHGEVDKVTAIGQEERIRMLNLAGGGVERRDLDRRVSPGRRNSEERRVP